MDFEELKEVKNLTLLSFKPESLSVEELVSSDFLSLRKDLQEVRVELERALL